LILQAREKKGQTREGKVKRWSHLCENTLDWDSSLL